MDATGVWAAEPDHPFSGGVDADPAESRRPPRRAARRGSRTQMGLTIRVPGKIVFLVPWPDHWLIGTTDAPFDGPADRPTAAGWEVDQLLDTVNATMDVDLTRADVVGTYAGLRPLIAPSDGSTVKASREHRVTVEPSGVVRIGGGKYTTYRVMARDVDRRGPRPRPRRERPSDDGRAAAGRRGRRRTRWTGSRPSSRPSRPSARSDRRRRHAWSLATGRRPRASSRSARSWTCSGRSSPGRPFLEAEVAWAVRHELAAVARRRPGAPDPAGPGAARSRRGDRPAGRRDHGRRARLGRRPGRRSRSRPTWPFARREFSVAAPRPTAHGCDAASHGT